MPERLAELARRLRDAIALGLEAEAHGRQPGGVAGARHEDGAASHGNRLVGPGAAGGRGRVDDDVEVVRRARPRLGRGGDPRGTVGHALERKGERGSAERRRDVAAPEHARARGHAPDGRRRAAAHGLLIDERLDLRREPADDQRPRRHAVRRRVGRADDDLVAGGRIAQRDGERPAAGRRRGLPVAARALALLDEDARAGRCVAREHGSRERGGQPVAEGDGQRPDAGAAQADRRPVGHVEREGVALRAEVGDPAGVAERGLGELERGQTAAWRRESGRDRLASARRARAGRRRRASPARLPRRSAARAAERAIGQLDGDCVVHHRQLAACGDRVRAVPAAEPAASGGARDVGSERMARPERARPRRTHWPGRGTRAPTS